MKRYQIANENVEKSPAFLSAAKEELRVLYILKASGEPLSLADVARLSALSEDEALRVADALSRYPTRYYTCHCTGCEAYRHMLAALPTLGYLAAGDTLTL